MKLGEGEERDSIGRHYSYFSEEELVAMLGQVRMNVVFRATGRDRGLSGEIAPTVAGKLVFHPLAVFAATMVLPLAGLAPLSPEMQAAAVILAAVPMMGIYPILAQRFGRERSSVVAMLMATVLSFFTLSAVLWVINTHIL
jgi:predicted permease